MSEPCAHTVTTDTQGDTWVDCNKKSHTVIYIRCANTGCARYGKTIACKITSNALPVTYMPPMVPIRRVYP